MSREVRINSWHCMPGLAAWPPRRVLELNRPPTIYNKKYQLAPWWSYLSCQWQLATYCFAGRGRYHVTHMLILFTGKIFWRQTFTSLICEKEQSSYKEIYRINTISPFTQQEKTYHQVQNLRLLSRFPDKFARSHLRPRNHLDFVVSFWWCLLERASHRRPSLQRRPPTDGGKQ